MLKSVTAFLILLSPLAQAETDCVAVKLQAADQLLAACGSETELSPEEIAVFQDASRSLASDCSDSRAAETLDRGVLYKKLDLAENCSAKADVLAR
jgi:hypothetical protein